MTADTSIARYAGGFVVKRSLGRVHPTFDAAGAEAERLTAISGGEPFLVLQVVGVAPAGARDGNSISRSGVPLTVGKEALRAGR